MQSPLQDVPDPVYTRLGGPAHDEETSRKEYRSNHHRKQASFGDDLVIVRDEALAVEALAPYVDVSCDRDSHQYPEEWKRSHQFVPSACLFKF